MENQTGHGKRQRPSQAQTQPVQQDAQQQADDMHGIVQLDPEQVEKKLPADADPDDPVSP